MIKAGLKSWQGRFGLESPPSSGVREALQWFFLARLSLLFAILLVSSLQAVVSKTSVPEASQVLANGLLGAGFIFTLCQALFIESLPSRSLPIGNLVFDALLAAGWVTFSRSAESVTALIYLIYILGVALTFYQKGALIAAGLGIISLGAVGAARGQWSGYGWTPWAVYSLIFIIVGFVGGYLSEELLRTTERLKSESLRIKRLTALHEMILENMPTGLLTVDHGGRINFVNRAGEHILGKEAPQVVGKELAEAVPGLVPFFGKIDTAEVLEPGQDADEAVGTIGTASHRSAFVKSSGERYRLQQTVETGKQILRGDVAKLDADAGIGQILGEGGGKILLFQDVTKVVHLEDKLKQHEKLAAVGQLAAGIAHEIRNPLASMSASIQMLKGMIPEHLLNAENHKLMDIVVREIDRLNDLISEFLDYVKPEQFKRTQVDLSAILSEVVQTVQTSKEYQAKVSLKQQLVNGVTVFGNAEKLKQVIWNLVMNAIQAIPTKGAVEIGCETGIEQARFWVEDTGAGMTEEVLRHLYEPFFTTKPKGTGLGLATAYRIIEVHRGEIMVKSKLNVGTRFEVILPVRESRD